MDEAVIYYRRSDGGWGVPPQAATLQVRAGNTQATLTWNVPENTVIEDQEVCRAAGVIIRRSTSGYPADENSGDLVINSTTLSSTYTDTGLTNDTTYYYRAFTYSDHNVFNRDPAAEGSATPSEAAHIILTFPTIMNGETITATNGETSYTGTVSEGAVDIAVYETGTWTVCGIDVTVSALGEDYNLNIPIFAFHYSETDSSPDSVDYPTGYTNSGYTTPFSMNLSTGVPSYGDWDPAGTNADDVRMIYPKSCMLKYTGERDYYLSESDETLKEDGVTASDVANSSYAGNAMMEWGQDGVLYWKLVSDEDNDGFTFIVSNAEVLGMKPWNHYDVNGNVTPHWYTPKYFGSSDGTRMRSISGGSNFVNNAGTTEISYAEANNQTSDKIWTTEVYCDYIFIGLLCCLISKSMNTQSKFGRGRVDTSSAIGQGTMNGKGMFYGVSNGTDGVKIFGMENFYGNLYRRVRGLINISGSYRIKMTYDQTDGSTVDGYNTDGSGYINAGNIGATGTWVYPKHMIVLENCLLAQTNGGSESTYYCDGTYLNGSGTYYAFVGGLWDVAGMAGVFCVNLNNAVSDSYASSGAALSCKPLAA